jgi:general secretion pathway protein G
MRRQNNRRGFTLIELLVVILILAILAALIVPNMMGHSDDAKRARALADVQELQTALSTFRMQNDRYPSMEEGLQALVSPPADVPNWRGPYIVKLPLDPWGNEYQYEDLGTEEIPMIKSFGADSAEGGSGNGSDITNKDDSASAPQ